MRRGEGQYDRLGVDTRTKAERTRPDGTVEDVQPIKQVGPSLSPDPLLDRTRRLVRPAMAREDLRPPEEEPPAP